MRATPHSVGRLRFRQRGIAGDSATTTNQSTIVAGDDDDSPDNCSATPRFRRRLVAGAPARRSRPGPAPAQPFGELLAAASGCRADTASSVGRRRRADRRHRCEQLQAPGRWQRGAHPRCRRRHCADDLAVYPCLPVERHVAAEQCRRADKPPPAISLACADGPPEQGAHCAAAVVLASEVARAGNRLPGAARPSTRRRSCAITPVHGDDFPAVGRGVATSPRRSIPRPPEASRGFRQIDLCVQALWFSAAATRTTPSISLPSPPARAVALLPNSRDSHRVRRKGPSDQRRQCRRPATLASNEASARRDAGAATGGAGSCNSLLVWVQACRARQAALAVALSSARNEST